MDQPLRILVVDDNPQDRLLVIRELRKAYPNAVLLESIDQAQLSRHLADADFDVVVTDYHLQWSNGLHVLQAVKDRMPHCPVIMFTATGNEEIAVEAMKRGLDDYIIKNVRHLVRLRGAVQAAVERAQTRARAQQLASRLDSLLKQLDVGIFTCSSNGSFLQLNQPMLDLLGCSSIDEAAGLTIASLFAGIEDAQSFLRRVADSNEPQETEIEIAADESSCRVYRVNARWIEHDGDEPRVDGLVEDVTRLKQSEARARATAVATAQVAMLSRREKEVFDLVALGHANKVVAHHLHISEKTVEKHRANLMKKLRLRTVADLVRLAILVENSST